MNCLARHRPGGCCVALDEERLVVLCDTVIERLDVHELNTALQQFGSNNGQVKDWLVWQQNRHAITSVLRRVFSTGQFFEPMRMG